MSGNATPWQPGALLMALRVRGKAVEEIPGGNASLLSLQKKS